jgi:hypothetical protein
LRTRDPDLLAAGARLVFVGTGLPLMAADFARQHAGPWPVLSDAKKRAFVAAGMRRGLFTVLHWRSVVSALRALRGGFRQGKVQGDPLQQGGVLVLDARGRLLHQQLDVASGDALDLAAILAAATTA